VTAGARIHLYSYLDTLQDKAIYCVTDSAKYVQPLDKPSLVETGDKLGVMTSELIPNKIICEVVCADSKNYAYRTVNTMTAECKRFVKLGELPLIIQPLTW
jgi:hypothetical protein